MLIIITYKNVDCNINIHVIHNNNWMNKLTLCSPFDGKDKYNRMMINQIYNHLQVNTCIYLKQLIIISLYSVSILTLHLLILSFICCHLIWLIIDTTFLYLIIVLLLHKYTHVFLMVKFLALFFSQCMLSHRLPLLSHTISYTIHLLMTYNYRYLLPLANYPSYFTIGSHVQVMSELGHCEHA